eukprot:14282720-Ditylum_brightwellii.AAC.1
MERTEISANVGSACDVMNNLSAVQPSMILRPPRIPPVYVQALPILHKGHDSQVLCSASDPYSTETGQQKNSLSDEDYHQSDDGDHYSELEELPHYLEKETVKGQKDFSIENMYKEEAKELDCNSEIDGEEIDDLHDMAHIAKDVKAMLKEEDDAAGDTPFQIPEDWKPNKKKAAEPDFKDVDNPGAWPEFCYRASFSPKDEYI